MNETTHTEAVQTDIPSHKPNRRKRLALRFAALVVAISMLGAAYWFTRPPELVWWRSPPSSNSGLRVLILIPRNWDEDSVILERKQSKSDWQNVFQFSPSDNRPEFLKWLISVKPEDAKLHIVFGKTPHIEGIAEREHGIQRSDREGFHSAIEYRRGQARNTYWVVGYVRSNLPAFNRTYRQICNSLTIE